MRGVPVAVQPEQLLQLLQATGPFQAAYFSGCLQRMSDAVLAAFPGGQRQLPSPADVQKCIGWGASACRAHRACMPDQGAQPIQSSTPAACRCKQPSLWHTAALCARCSTTSAATLALWPSAHSCMHPYSPPCLTCSSAPPAAASTRSSRWVAAAPSWQA